MQVSEEERLAANREAETPEPKSNMPIIIAAAIAALVMLAVAVYVLRTPEQVAEPVPVPTLEPAPAEPEPPTPQVPVRETSEPEFSLPPLDQSDTDFRERLINLSPSMAPWLQTEELVRRSISFTDGLTRGELLTKLVSVPPPAGKFKVEEQDEQLYLADENFARYGYLVDIIDSVNAEMLTELFDLYRPLLEQAYGELGYKPETLGARVINALDQILGVPVTDKAIELKHESVYYTFADPKLEAMSSLQKQLIRMGPKATEIVQQKAKVLKEYLLAAPEQPAEQAQ